MQGADRNEDILIQGDAYEPTGEVEDDSSESPSKLNKFTGNPKFMKKLPAIILGGIFLIVVLIGGYILTGNKEEVKAGIDETPEFLKELEEESYEFKYDENEVYLLRQAGYTGTEIEQFELDQIFVDEKLEEAKVLRQNLINEEILPYLDGASDKFKELKSNTWLGGLEFGPPKPSTDWTYHTYELNADYEKIEARGHQLFIKIYLTSGQPAFVNIMPELYYGLNEIGNIVVEIDYTDVGSQKLITDIRIIK